MERNRDEIEKKIKMNKKGETRRVNMKAVHRK